MYASKLGALKEELAGVQKAKAAVEASLASAEEDAGRAERRAKDLADVSEQLRTVCTHRFRLRVWGAGVGCGVNCGGFSDQASGFRGNDNVGRKGMLVLTGAGS